MNKIGFKNLRSLADTGMIELKPINLLVGKNNSGKSTFLRAFPLLRQSMESRIIGPILWYGNYVDFGSFEEAKYSYSDKDEITFLFEFNDPNKLFLRSLRFSKFYLFSNYEDTTDINIKIKLAAYISPGPRSSSLIGKICFDIEGNKVDIEIDSTNISSIWINGTNFSDYISEYKLNQSAQGFLPELVFHKNRPEKIYDNIIFRKLMNEFMKYHNPKTGDEKIITLLSSIPIASSQVMLNAMKSFPKATKTWKKNVNTWSLDSKEFNQIKDLLILLNLESFFLSTNFYVNGFSQQIRYIAPIRASAERYYRRQNLAVDEIDFQGKNLAMYLNNLTQKEKKDFDDWTSEYFGLIFSTIGTSGPLSIQVKNLKLNEMRNLTDTGFGYSQVLPIITQLFFLEKSRKTQIYRINPLERYFSRIPLTYAIEQPELHLHPAMQSKLAAAFVNTVYRGKENEKDIRLIIETHSETIINQFGHLIFSDKYNPEDINIIIFSPNIEKKCTEINIAKYNEEGILEEWPIGFFEPDINL